MKLDINYIAGFLDGEGCIHADRNKGIRVVITNTRKNILEAIRGYFNTGKIYIKKRTKKDKSKLICYYWVCWNRQAEKVLKILQPYIIIKSDQVKVALEFMTTMRKHGAEKGNWGNLKLSQDVWDYRTKLANKLKELKYAS